MDDVAAISAEFPLLLPEDPDWKILSGFVAVGTTEYALRIDTSATTTVSAARLEGDWRLQQLLQEYGDVIHQRMRQSASVLVFLRELRALIEKVHFSGLRTSVAPASLCPTLVRELQDVGWAHLQSLDSSMSVVELRCTDARGCDHTVRVQLSDRYPMVAPRCGTRLPIPFQLHWPARSGSLALVFQQFKRAVADCEPLWDVLSDIDAHAWVLEPKDKAMDIPMRRIVITDNTSLQIVFDPLRLHVMPDCRFLGPEHAVRPLRERCISGSSKWKREESVLANLQAILNVTFPAPAGRAIESLNCECGVCFTYDLNGNIPDKVCDEPTCGHSFHRECILEWLRALPTTRQSFGTLFGECPYCTKTLSVNAAA